MQRCFTIVALLVLSGCGLTIPQYVQNRKPFTTFDPTGTWSASGEFLHAPADGTQLEIAPDGPESDFYRVVRKVPGVKPISGLALVDGNTLYVSYNAGWIYLFDSHGQNKPDPLDSIGGYGHGKVLYQKLTPGKYSWGGYGGTWSVEGQTTSRTGTYGATAIIGQDGDHWTLSLDNNVFALQGAGLLVDDKLFIGGITTRSQDSYGAMNGSGPNDTIIETTTRDGGFVTAVYRLQGDKLVGQSIFNNTYAKDRFDNHREHIARETLSRVK